MGVKHEHLGNTDLCTALRKWFAEPGMDDVVPVPIGYPVRSGKPAIVMARKERHDPYSTPFNSLIMM